MHWNWSSALLWHPSLFRYWLQDLGGCIPAFISWQSMGLYLISSAHAHVSHCSMRRESQGRLLGCRWMMVSSRHSHVNVFSLQWSSMCVKEGGVLPCNVSDVWRKCQRMYYYIIIRSGRYILPSLVSILIGCPLKRKQKFCSSKQYHSSQFPATYSSYPIICASILIDMKKTTMGEDTASLYSRN